MTGERKPQLVVRSQFNELQGKFSPDGQWIAYVSNESGRAEIYIQGFPKAARAGRGFRRQAEFGRIGARTAKSCSSPPPLQK